MPSSSETPLARPVPVRLKPRISTYSAGQICGTTSAAEQFLKVDKDIFGARSWPYSGVQKLALPVYDQNIDRVVDHIAQRSTGFLFPFVDHTIALSDLVENLYAICDTNDIRMEIAGVFL
jgi:hypothetical protein